MAFTTFKESANPHLVAMWCVDVDPMLVIDAYVTGQVVTIR